MFREITRIKQKISEEECRKILKEEKRGVLSVITPEGYPYGMPIDHYYDEEENCLYFHTGKKGHRNDCLKENNRVSYCVYDQGQRNEGEWALHFQSVICFGRIEEVEDYEKGMDIARRLSAKFTDDTAYVEDDIRRNGHRTLILKLNIEHMTGKSVEES